MSVEVDLRNVLLPICARVFPDFAPVATTRPYITYQQIGGQVIKTLAKEVPSKQNGEFQINVWADTRKQAAELSLQIEAVLRQATQFVASPLAAPTADYDPDMPVYGTRQDFSIWSDR